MGLSTAGCRNTQSLFQRIYRGEAVSAGPDQPEQDHLAAALAEALGQAGLSSADDLPIFVINASPADAAHGLTSIAPGTPLTVGLAQARQRLDEGAQEIVLAARFADTTPSGAAAIVIQYDPEAASVFAWLDLEAKQPPTAGLVVSNSSAHQWSPEEEAWLLKQYPGDSNQPTTAWSSSSATLATSPGSQELLGLIYTALCLSNRILPAQPQWNGPSHPAAQTSTSLFVPMHTQTWFSGETRRSAIVLLNNNGSESKYLWLYEGARQPGKHQPDLGPIDYFLLPISGADAPALHRALQVIQQQVGTAESLATLSQQLFAQFSPAPTDLVLVLAGHDPVEISKEIEYAGRGIEKALAGSGEWQTPIGSYLTTQPLGPEGQIAFVYPGAFNSYIDLGRELFSAFPAVYEHMLSLTGDLGTVLREQLLYPRSLTPLTPDELAAREAVLNADAVAMLSSGAALAVAYTLALQDYFNIQPGSAFGYSLGENSMLFALQVWTQGQNNSLALESSPLFHVRISGRKETVQEYWGYTEKIDDPDLWHNYVLMASPTAVQAAIGQTDQVFLTHINTPRQVVIGGSPAACQQVIKTVGCPSLRAPFDHVLHCAAMASEYPAMTELNMWPVANRPTIPLYSAADYHPLRLESQPIAKSIAKMLCSPLDFPRLIHLAYANGARIFIELGAGSNCSKWIDDTLKGQAHLSLAINRKGVSDAEGILRVVARLISHRVPLNLGILSRQLAAPKLEAESR